MLVGKRVLVVEPEFLVALDLQRLLESAGATETAFARSVGEARQLDGHFARYDLVLVDVPGEGVEATGLIRQLREEGIAGVAMTTGTLHRPAPGVPLLGKPFTDDTLLAACDRAMAGRPLAP
jgi:CheY-like chemotaxis protein